MADVRLLTSDAFEMALDPSEDPGTSFQPLDAMRDVEIGVWEIEAGDSLDTEADEVLLVLKGEGTVEFIDGSAIRLVPGVVVRLHAGDRTVWRIVSPMRKLYIG